MVNNFAELTSKEMSRKEFLQNAGVGMLLLLGGGMIVRALGLSQGSSNRASSVGYGASVYGGRK